MFNLSFSDWISLLGFVVFACTLIAMVKDLKEATKSRRADVLDRIYDRFSSKEAVEDRHYVYTKLASQSPLVDYDFRIAERVWRQINHLGLLVKYGLIEEELLMESWHIAFTKCWKKLEPHIKYQRDIRKGPYQKYFKWLAERAEEYHKKHYPEEPIEFHEEFFEEGGRYKPNPS